MSKPKRQPLVLIPEQRIINQIFLIRGKKVMLDKDLAKLYGVQTRALNQAVRRNMQRFPEDFMFQLSEKEFKNLKSQFVTSSWGGRRKKPLAFTEQGVAMLSSVLNSKRAIQVNIQIVRTFTKLRELLATNKELRRKIETMERDYGQKFKKIFQVIEYLLTEEDEPKREIGFGREG